MKNSFGFPLDNPPETRDSLGMENADLRRRECPDCRGSGVEAIPCMCGAYAAEHGCGGIKGERTCERCQGTGNKKEG